MRDIKSPALLWTKMLLFLITGLLASATALVLFPSARLALLMAIAIWSFCRAYYFVFYVIEHYIDPTYRFAGLLSVLQYLRGHRKNRNLT